MLSIVELFFWMPRSESLRDPELWIMAKGSWFSVRKAGDIKGPLKVQERCRD